MITVTAGNNMKRANYKVSGNTVYMPDGTPRTYANEVTLRNLLEVAGIDYNRGTMHLDGATLQPGQLDQTFSAMGITEKCFLLNVVKADNAVFLTIQR